MIELVAHGALGGRFQPRSAVLAGQIAQPHRRAEARFRMRLVREYRFHQAPREDAHRAGPLKQTLRRPLAITLVRLGLVTRLGAVAWSLMAAHMRGHAFAAIEHFHRGGRVAQFHHLLRQLIRH